MGFPEMAFGKVDDEERDGVGKATEAYLGLHTGGMVGVVDRVKRLVWLQGRVCFDLVSFFGHTAMVDPQAAAAAE